VRGGDKKEGKKERVQGKGVLAAIDGLWDFCFELAERRERLERKKGGGFKQTQYPLNRKKEKKK